MAWLVLVVSGMLEAVWATALGRSAGLTRLGPTAVFLVAVTLSMVGLATAMRSLPVGTGYAVWVGIGAALTVGYAMVTGAEPASERNFTCRSGRWWGSWGWHRAARAGGRRGRPCGRPRRPGPWRGPSRLGCRPGRWRC